MKRKMQESGRWRAKCYLNYDKGRAERVSGSSRRAPASKREAPSSNPTTAKTINKKNK
jgi:hypothetical protein